MNIAINALPYNSYQGIENFLTNLLRQLPDNQSDQVTVFANAISVKFLHPLPDHIKVKVIELKKINKLNIFIFQQLYFSKLLKKESVDILFCASLNCPWLYNKKIVTIHDAAPFVVKHETTFLGKIYWRLSLFFIKHFSLSFITVSEFSKQELVDKLNIPENKIDVIYNGTPEISKEVYTANQTTGNPYILTIGNARERKNLNFLLSAFQKINQSHPKLELIIIGKMDERMSSLANKYQAENIKFTGFISDEQKYKLISGAEMLIFPSLYEGFGIPILEAQTLDTPVLCSDIPAFHEIANDSAVFFNPKDESDLINKLKLMLNHTEENKKLINKGEENIKRFNWEKSAKKLKEIITRYENPPN